MAETDLIPASKLIAIGGSAGSLNVVIGILQTIPRLTAALIIVIHRKNIPDSPLARLLGGHSVLAVKEAEDKEPILPGTVYLAPADYHVLVENERIFSLDASEKVHYSRPSIDVTFESAAAVYGLNLTGVILSGGNQDGAAGLRLIEDMGGKCIIQDPASATVPFMPQSAAAACRYPKILKPAEISGFLYQL